MGRFVAVGGIEFNVTATKKLGKRKFIEIYKGKLKGIDIEDAWYKAANIKKKSK